MHLTAVPQQPSDNSDHRLPVDFVDDECGARWATSTDNIGTAGPLGSLQIEIPPGIVLTLDAASPKVLALSIDAQKEDTGSKVGCIELQPDPNPMNTDFATAVLTTETVERVWRAALADRAGESDSDLDARSRAVAQLEFLRETVAGPPSQQVVNPRELVPSLAVRLGAIERRLGRALKTDDSLAAMIDLVDDDEVLAEHVIRVNQDLQNISVDLLADYEQLRAVGSDWVGGGQRPMVFNQPATAAASRERRLRFAGAGNEPEAPRAPIKIPFGWPQAVVDKFELPLNPQANGGWKVEFANDRVEGAVLVSKTNPLSLLVYDQDEIDSSSDWSDSQCLLIGDGRFGNADLRSLIRSAREFAAVELTIAEASSDQVRTEAQRRLLWRLSSAFLRSGAFGHMSTLLSWIESSGDSRAETVRRELEKTTVSLGEITPREPVSTVWARLEARRRAR